jgi:hypothetical protein
MSKELLKRVRDTLHGLEETHYDLYWDIQTALDQPEQEPVAWRWKKTSGWAYQENSNNGGEPLYLAPPKREPPMTAREMYQRGYAKAERDLKREPLSEDAICEVLLKKEWKGFVDLVRIIEKMHGIGGGE